MTAWAQVQKPIQPGSKIFPKVEKSPIQSAGIQWTSPTKQYVGDTDAVPSGIVKLANFKIELPPGKSFDFPVPLHRGGTMVSVKAVPEGMEPQKPLQRKASVALSRGANVEGALQPLLQEQKRERETKVLSLSLIVGTQSFLPIESLSGRYKFLLIIGSQYSGYGTGKCVIKNISNGVFKGMVYASSTDYAQKDNFETQKQQMAIQSAIDHARNPDMLWVLTQSLKRHLLGYPGGKSDYEDRFSNTLSQFKVPMETLRTLSNTLTAHENRIAQRVVNKDILQIRDGRPIKMEMIRPILKMERAVPKTGFQPAPKPEFKVAEPKVKPGQLAGQLAAPQPKITVLYPNGGEIWEEGKTYTIRWTSENVQGNVNIQLWWSLTGPGGLHTIMNVPNTGSYNFTVPKLSEQVRITPYLGISSMDGKAGDWSDNVFTIRRPGADEKYMIRLIGVMSHRCADDEGWEYGCDAEEPYILWTAFGPGYEAYGRTEEGRDVEKNDTWLYGQDVNVFGGGTNRTQAIPVNSPLIFVYMVIEKDSGSPTRDQILGAAKSGVAAVAALFTGDWAVAIAEGIEFIYDVIVIFQRIAAKGDDLYPPYVSYFDHNTLLSLTTGSGNPPLDRALVSSVGNYDHLSIRRADIYSDPIIKRGLQWSVFYMILRGF